MERYTVTYEGDKKKTKIARDIGMFQRYLDQKIDDKSTTFPFHVTSRDLSCIEVSFLWTELEELSEAHLRQYATPDAAYTANVEVGGFERGEFTRTLKIDVVEKKSRMASEALARRTRE